MKKNRNSLIWMIFITGVSVQLSYSQNTLYIPIEFEQAYKSGTRNYNGKPGKNYWQNSANYEIEAEIIPEKSMLRGKESITYYNNSPDTLHSLVIQLFQDMYKKGSKRKKYIIPSDVTDGTNILHLYINNEQVDINDNDNVSRQDGLLKIKLSKPILPGTTAKLLIAWDFHIPEKTYIRTARFDSTSFFIAYWFPRLAVYDDIFGWDNYGYDGLHEFNNDYGNFNVRIKVPDNYLIWTNGELKNPDSVYSNEIIEKLSELKNNNQPLIISSGNSSPNNKGNGFKEWRFTSLNTKDFAFGLSDHHSWDAIRFKIGDGTEKQVNVVYHPESKAYFETMTIHLMECIKFFSDELPGINYPYPEYTAFQGLKPGWHSAIEFPGMSNYSYKTNDSINKSMFAHELAHNYLPFYVNINETQYQWLEEGLTSYIELALMRDLLGLERFDVWEDKHPLDIYSGRINDIPPFTPSTMYEWNMVTQTAYYRPSYAYIILEDLLGKQVFLNCFREFINRWSGKRPIPHDLFNSFNDISGQNLDWFWKPWFFEFGYPDLAIEKVERNVITIKKIGVIPVPVHVKVTYEDDSYEELYETAEVWKNGNDFFELSFSKNKKVKKIVLSDKIEIPDVNRTNNIYTDDN